MLNLIFGSSLWSTLRVYFFCNMQTTNMNLAYFNPHSSMEPSTHSFLSSVNSGGWDDVVTIHYRNRSMAISAKLYLFYVFLLSLLLLFYFFVTCETCVSNCTPIFMLWLNTQPCSQGILAFWCKGRYLFLY